jgi:hypothetical protein
VSAENELLQAGIRDANAALVTIQSFDEHWHNFAAACQARQFEAAHVLAERMVTLVETATDLFLTSNKRLAQFERLTKGDDA